MRCPYCDAEEDKVVDSRLTEEGRAIRRRRECLTCHRRYTTFERAEEVPMVVRKRDGGEEPFERHKIVEGIRRAAKNRPVELEQIEAMASSIEEELRAEGRRGIGYSDIGRRVLERLATVDEVAYLRFASVYKSFQELDDFERELGVLLKKSAHAEESSPNP
ncbi:MAG TPA: transcriptional regulator NrdR [Actinomycetota bacterium]|nr:transcriptional regulator NrdR [Actinomycetota bacterium]